MISVKIIEMMFKPHVLLQFRGSLLAKVTLRTQINSTGFNVQCENFTPSRKQREKLQKSCSPPKSRGLKHCREDSRQSQRRDPQPPSPLPPPSPAPAPAPHPGPPCLSSSVDAGPTFGTLLVNSQSRTVADLCL